MEPDSARIFYGVGLISLHLPYSQSLKDKRAVIKSLKDRLSERSRVAVMDVGPQDLWQRASLGVCLVARDDAAVRTSLGSLLRIVEGEDRAVVLSFQTRIGCLGDESYEGDG